MCTSVDGCYGKTNVTVSVTTITTVYQHVTRWYGLPPYILF
jgi:hypothetical protein